MTDSKTFVLRSEEIKANCIDLIKKIGTKTIYAVTIEPYRKRRSLEQNARLWAILDEIASAWHRETGKYYAPETWLIHFKKKFLGCEVMEVGGEIDMVPKPSRKLKVNEFSDFMVQIEAWAVDEGILV